MATKKLKSSKTYAPTHSVPERDSSADSAERRSRSAGPSAAVQNDMPTAQQLLQAMQQMLQQNQQFQQQLMEQNQQAIQQLVQQFGQLHVQPAQPAPAPAPAHAHVQHEYNWVRMNEKFVGGDFIEFLDDYVCCSTANG